MCAGRRAYIRQHPASSHLVGRVVRLRAHAAGPRALGRQGARVRRGLCGVVGGWVEGCVGAGVGPGVVPSSYAHTRSSSIVIEPPGCWSVPYLAAAVGSVGQPLLGGAAASGGRHPFRGSCLGWAGVTRCRACVCLPACPPAAAPAGRAARSVGFCRGGDWINGAGSARGSKNGAAPASCVRWIGPTATASWLARSGTICGRRAAHKPAMHTYTPPQGHGWVQEARLPPP